MPSLVLIRSCLQAPFPAFLLSRTTLSLLNLPANLLYFLTLRLTFHTINFLFFLPHIKLIRVSIYRVEYMHYDDRGY